MLAQWYLLQNGQMNGPYADDVIIAWIGQGMTDVMVRPSRADENSSWLPLWAHPPFAAALVQLQGRRQTVPGALNKRQIWTLFVGGLLAVGAFAWFMLGKPQYAAVSSPPLEQPRADSDIDDVCRNLSDKIVDLTTRGILDNDELKAPPEHPPHVSAIQLRRTRSEFMAQCLRFEPEIRACMKASKTLLDYELCTRSDGEMVRDN
ncbi:MAG TPA: hypothetical protein VK745_27925 [Polyangiaceae bacterium]|jgi:hypothetical protein|nr:hypothetical protein [Polyangiaceae bacterium]